MYSEAARMHVCIVCARVHTRHAHLCAHEHTYSQVGAVCCVCTRARVCAPGAGGRLGRGTLTGFLLGTERVALITEAGVGARQVAAARLPAGPAVCTLVHVCKKTSMLDRGVSDYHGEVLWWEHRVSGA